MTSAPSQVGTCLILDPYGLKILGIQLYINYCTSNQVTPLFIFTEDRVLVLNQICYFYDQGLTSLKSMHLLTYQELG